MTYLVENKRVCLQKTGSWASNRSFPSPHCVLCSPLLHLHERETSSIRRQSRLATSHAVAHADVLRRPSAAANINVGPFDATCQTLSSLRLHIDDSITVDAILATDLLENPLFCLAVGVVRQRRDPA